MIAIDLAARETEAAVAQMLSVPLAADTIRDLSAPMPDSEVAA